MGCSSANKRKDLLGAEHGGVAGDGVGDLDAGGGEHVVRLVVGVVEAHDHRGVAGAGGALLPEGTVVVRGVQGAVNLLHSARVGAGAARVAHGLSKLGAHDHCLLHGGAVPEQVGVADFLPQVAGVAAVARNHVVQVILDRATIVLAAVASPQVLRDVVLLSCSNQAVGSQNQSSSSGKIQTNKPKL
jgi:hypothetical protein